jgi:acetyltransferase-like isoleucine patch superfamily enzyme
MRIKSYVGSIFSLKKWSRNISLLSMWDDATTFSNDIFIGSFTRITNSNIGRYTRIKPLCSIFNAKIGNFCSIAKGVKIGLGKHPTNLLSTNSVFYKDGIRKDWAIKIPFKEEEQIIIGNDVWIGIEAIILDGIKIGNGAIIATRSVVTRDVPPYAVVGGVPAKIIKYRFDEDIINKIQETEWWNLEDTKIKDILPLFTIPNPTIKDLEKYLN